MKPAKLCLIGLLIFSTNLSAARKGKAPAEQHDLTKGYMPKSKPDFNVGPTGFRGWAENRPRRKTPDFSRSRQILVTAVDETQGSPAAGKLKVGDVILGADGTGAAGEPALFSSNARFSIAGAIADAEARDPATLKLLVWRPKDVETRKEGKQGTVTLTLQTMGAYSDTAPYNCEKSRKILRQGLEAFYSKSEARHNGRGVWGLGMLVLMAGDDPTNPRNKLYQERVREWAHMMIMSEKEIKRFKYSTDYLGSGNGKIAWGVAYRLYVLAEYYLKTKDPAVFPTLEALAIAFARGQTEQGLVSHSFAAVKGDGSPHGRLLGYGAINGVGVPGFLGLVLARKAGVDDKEVLAGINRPANFFGRYLYKGFIPYGGQSARVLYGYEMNGKCGTAAVAYKWLPDRKEEARYFARMAMNDVDPNSGRLMSHGGPYFNYVWPPLGAAVVGPEAAHYYLKHYYWLYDLSRRWDGSVEFDAYGTREAASQYKARDFPRALTTLLTYALPLRQIYATGRDDDKSLWLSREEFKEACSGNFKPNEATEEECWAAMNTWDPIKGQKAAGALVRLYDKQKKDKSDLWRRLKEVILDKNNPLGFRIAAARALSHSGGRGGYLEIFEKTDDDLIRSILKWDIRPPASQMNRYLALIKQGKDFTQVVAGPRRALSGKKLPSEVDRELLVEALIGQALHHGRYSWMANTLNFLTDEEVLKVAPALISAGLRPSRDTKIISFLAEKRIAEGVRLAIGKAIDEQGIRRAAGGYKILKQYGPSIITVVPPQELLQFLYQKKAEPFRLYYPEGVIPMVKNAKESDVKPLTYLKRIESVVPEAESVTLPKRSTTLQVTAVNHGVFDAKDNRYTWRKLDGPGKVSFAPNGTWDSKTTTVEFSDAEPGKYRFEIAMTDKYALTTVRDTVTVTLMGRNGKLPANRPPKATAQNVTAAPGIPVRILLSGVDPEKKPMSYYVVSRPEHGELKGDPPKLTYTGFYGHQGDDSFTFRVVDSHGESDTATVAITFVETATPVTVYESFAYKKGGLSDANGGFGWAGKWGASKYGVVGEGEQTSFANLPSAGPGRFITSNRYGASRKLDVNALNRDGLLDDGRQLFLSIVFSYEHSERGKGRLKLRLAGPDTSVGFDKGCLFADGKHGTSSKAGSMAPETTTMYIMRCRWGKTPEDNDIMDLHRVFEYPAGHLNLLKEPISRLEAVIPQKTINELKFVDRLRLHNVYNIRIGPSLLSVLRGTVPGGKR